MRRELLPVQCLPLRELAHRENTTFGHFLGRVENTRPLTAPIPTEARARNGRTNDLSPIKTQTQHKLI